MTELEYLKKSFHRIFAEYKTKKIVIYGIGFRTEMILNEFRDFNIVGVLDGAKNNGWFCDKKILTLEETAQLKPDIIIVIAQPSSTEAIFQRIGKFCLVNNITLFNMHGRNLYDIYKINQHCMKKESLFDISEDELKKQIEEHDVISFDIFDTVIMRKTLLPQDVFDIVEETAKRKGGNVVNFKKCRIQSETEIAHTSPNIYEIYNNLAKKMDLSEEEKNTLMNLEIEVEKKVIISRRKTVDIIDFAISLGKKVYLISDMYLPRDIIIDILDKLGIKNYMDIFVSCDYHKAKCNGLYEIFKKIESEGSYLHIGDNEECDGIFAATNKMDVFLIKSAYEMLKLSSYSDIVNNLNNINERSLVGLFISKVFNDPFALYKSGGRPLVSETYDFGYMFVAPLVTTFMVWLQEQLNQSDYEDVLFSARDGYLIQQLYNYMKSEMKLDYLPKGKYFETSRTLCIKACIESDDDISWVCTLPFAFPPAQMVAKRFELDEKDVLEYDENKYKSVYEYALKHKKLIYNNSSRVRNNYLKYMESIGLKSGMKYAIFDFVSTGTCQYPLSKITDFELEGLYFCRYLVQDEIKNKLPIKALFMNGYISYGSASYLIENYMLLETIITSLNSSLISIDENGKPIYCEETRSKEELEFVNLMHIAISDFFKDYISTMFVRDEKIGKSISDKLYSFKDGEYTNERCSIFDTLMLRDDFGQGKIPLLRKK